MQASDFIPLFSECCAEVLESMYFTTVLDSSSYTGQQAAPQPAELAFSLRFQGEVHGAFGLHLGAPMARTLAANFLGEEEDSLTDVEVAEVVGELTNMICGSIVSRVEGTTKFALSHPEPFTPGPAEPDILTSKLETDSGDLYTWISIDPPADNSDSTTNPLLQATL